MVMQRQRETALRLIANAIGRGLTVSLYDSFGLTTIRRTAPTDDIEQIRPHVGGCFTQELVLYREGRRVGFIMLVYPVNEMADLVHDYTDSEEIGDIIYTSRDESRTR